MKLMVPTVCVGLLLVTGCSKPAAQHNVPLGNKNLCGAYSGLPEGWSKHPHAGMVHIAAGTFVFGSTRGYADERPQRSVRVRSFWIDRTEVTNAQFADFVAATGYVTDAERGGGAAVFVMPTVGDTVKPGNWWQLINSASWRHPHGANSGKTVKGHAPVVNVTYRDALAYAHWLGRELPTEQQWEFAAKARHRNAAADRNLRDMRGKPLANVWQGFFPLENRIEDGFAARAPVGCFSPNRNGLYDMIGNVWEWTADLYDNRHSSKPTVAKSPKRRVIKGGSFLCADNY